MVKFFKIKLIQILKLYALKVSPCVCGFEEKDKILRRNFLLVCVYLVI